MTEEENKRRGRKPSQESTKAFPKVFRSLSESQEVTQTEISAALGISTAYVSQLATGVKTPGPETIDKLAAAMELDEAATRKLHTAAAKDMGFRLDLPDDF